MGEVKVEKVEIESYLETKEAIKSILRGEPIKVKFVADGGNGAVVDLHLKTTAPLPEDLRFLLKTEEIKEEFNRLGFSLRDNRKR